MDMVKCSMLGEEVPEHHWLKPWLCVNYDSTLFYNDPWLKKLTEYDWVSDQTWRFTDQSPCGGPDGQLSVYTDFKAKAVNTLEVQPVNFKGEDVWDGATGKTTKMITVGEKVWIKATIGEYTCTSFRKCKGTVADDDRCERYKYVLTFFLLMIFY